MKLSFIYVNWNSTNLLEDSLKSLDFSRLEDDSEVIIIDNASVSFHLQYDFNEIPYEIINNQDNVGFAAANNQGYRLASGDIIILVNPDTLLNAHTINTLVNFITTHPNVAIAGPELVDLQGNRETSVYPPLTVFREALRLFHIDRFIQISLYDFSKMDLSTWHSVGSVQGACMAIRKEALEENQIFDETYFMFSEEIDLCQSVRMRGWLVAWLPYVSIIHLGGQSTQLIEDEMFNQLYISKLQFYRKWFGRFGAWIFKIALIIASMIRISTAPFFALLNRRKKDYYLDIHRKYRQSLPIIIKYRI